MMCSELRYIYKDGTNFCKGLGFTVNENSDFTTWIDDLITNTTKKNQACWDSTPSSRV